MNIRTFHAGDTTDVVRLWFRCNLVTATNNPEQDIKRKLAVGRELFLVGEVNNGLVTTVMGGYDGHRGWVNYLAVDPEQRDRGLGRLMMENLEARLLSLGCPKINLQVRSNNAAVIAFYQALGYQTDPVTSLGKRLVADTKINLQQEPG